MPLQKPLASDTEYNLYSSLSRLDQDPISHLSKLRALLRTHNTNNHKESSKPRSSLTATHARCQELHMTRDLVRQTLKKEKENPQI